MYSELIDVPLIIFEPHRQKPETCSTLVSTIDIPPTIVHLFGLKPAGSFEGNSLVPLEGYPARGCYGEALDISALQERGELKEVHYYREEDLKVIFRETDDSWELYDLGGDAGELHNLMETSPAAEAMRGKLMPRIGRSRRHGAQLDGERSG
jgi:arylsulfatase A-like enzyme